MQAVHIAPSPINSFIFSQKIARFPEILRAVADRDASPGTGGEPKVEIQDVTEALLNWQLPALSAACSSEGLPSLPVETEVTFGS